MLWLSDKCVKFYGNSKDFGRIRSNWFWFDMIVGMHCKVIHLIKRTSGSERNVLGREYCPKTIKICRRRRRDLRNLLRLPGTKWCGKGYSATKYAELGGRSKADRCCRQHDKSCPYWIMGFETKYGLFNWRINTLMHCKCDDRYLVDVQSCCNYGDFYIISLSLSLCFFSSITSFFWLSLEICISLSWFQLLLFEIKRLRMESKLYWNSYVMFIWKFTVNLNNPA